MSDKVGPIRAVGQLWPSRFEMPQTLLVDLDDTLCENNIYFERAIAQFISFLNHKDFSASHVREIINQAERESILEHGYGIHSFAHSLVKSFERLSTVPITPDIHETISGFAHRIADHPLEVIDGVAETLDYLSSRHRLMVVTKGSITEQSAKIEHSGLKEFFFAVEIVSEKNEASYRAIISKYDLSSENTWMVGNSPKSDINPALAVGIHAVFVPHPQTWILEHESVNSVWLPNQNLLILDGFSDLKKHF